MNTEPHNHHALFSPLLIWREKLKTSAVSYQILHCGLVLNLLGDLGHELGELLAYCSPEVTEEVSFEGQMSL